MVNHEIFPHPLSVHNYILDIEAPGVGMYMESGLLDLEGIAPLDIETYAPSTLYYDAELDTYYSGNSTALLGELTVTDALQITYSPRDEGQSYSSVGCEEIDEIDQIIISENEFTGDTAAFSGSFCADAPGLLNRKRAQSFFPSSAFPGKLQGYVQSVYGSQRTDYYMDGDLGYLGGLTIGRYTFDPYFNTQGYVVYTDSNYYHYLLVLTSSNVQVARLEPSSQGENLRQWLLENPQSAEETKRYEAYIMSTASAGTFYEVGDVSSAYDKGGPLAYSWHSNWDGTEAHIVVIQEREEDDNVYETTHFKATISLSESETDGFWQESDAWSISVTEEESTQEVTFRDDADLVWTPDFIDGGMQIFQVQENAFSGPTQQESDVPIYVIYNYEDDDFDVVRYKREDLGTGVGALGGAFASQSTRAAPGCGTYDCGYYSKVNGSAADIGFYVSGIFDAFGDDSESVILAGNEASISPPSTFHSEVADEAATCGFGNGTQFWLSTLGNCGNSYDTCSPPDIAILDYIDGYAGGSYGTEIDISGDFTWQSTLLMPWYDCDAVYLGFWDSFDGTVTSAGRTEAGAEVVSGCRLFERAIFGGDEMTNGSIDRNEVGWDTAQGGGLPEIKLNAQNDGLWVSVSGEDTEWHHIDVRRIQDGADEQVYEQRVITNAAVAAVMIVPSCMDPTASAVSSDINDAPNWQEGASDTGGYEFDPVLYPTPENMPAVISRSNLSNNYRATKQPGEGSFVDDGGYDYDSFSHISFIGHA